MLRMAIISGSEARVFDISVCGWVETYLRTMWFKRHNIVTIEVYYSEGSLTIFPRRYLEYFSAPHL